MRADELEKIIEETYSDHWEVISGGPTFLHSYRVSGSGGDAGISAAEYHDAIAVLRGDVDVRIAWGYNPDFGEWDRQFFPDGTFADPTVSTMLVMCSTEAHSSSATGSSVWTAIVRPCRARAVALRPVHRR
jgi:hypothetical protein